MTDAHLRQFREDTGCPDRAASDAVLESIVARYREPHRRYHGVEHVVRVVDRVSELVDLVGPDATGTPDGAVHAAIVRLAAWYHDAIYDPRSPSNEDDSATLAVNQLRQLDVALDTCDAVRRLVLVTKTHTPSDADERILIDADLAVLGARPDVYDIYVAGVRAEYGFVDESAWRVGRAAVLQSFLGRDRIFHTETAHAACDHVARANLERELRALS